MTKLYWQARKVPLKWILLVCLLSVTSVAGVERWTVEARRPYFSEKLAAAELAQRAMGEIKRERLRRHHVIHPEFDPGETGLIGEYLTPVTSVSGHLESKQTSINPNFAALIVEMLIQAGVRRGDRVAVGYSGSFPALNICVCAALESLGARPVIIASASASQFGANMPDFLWIDMERHLNEKGYISFRSIAASYGGYEDRALGATDEGRRIIAAAIQRNGLSLVQSETFAKAIDERMQLYREAAGDNPVRAYINVGGGTISVGRSVGKKLYQPGLNLQASTAALEIDSVMTRFMKQGVPLIHLVQITKLAEKYDLPYAPTELPTAGQGSIYFDSRRSRWMAGGSLFLLVLVLQITSRSKDP